MEGSIKSEKKE